MTSDYERVARAIGFVGRRVADQPTLDEIAAAAGLSAFHFQRLFRRWAGVSPKRFLQFLTVEHAKRVLEGSRSVLEASFETGLSGPARLHDHFVSLEAVTPGEYKRRGADLLIRYGVHPSPFGSALLAVTERGVCGLSFLETESANGKLAELKKRWPDADIVADGVGTRDMAGQIFQRRVEPHRPLSVLVKGTNFQINVWKALLQVPPGALCSYERVARAIGKPAASRAVARALAENPVGYLIPCHRVIRNVGALGGYRWGSIRKSAMLGWEAAGAHELHGVPLKDATGAAARESASSA